MKNIFQPPFWKKLRKLQIKPSAVEWPQSSATVAVGLKSSATAVELRPSVQLLYDKNVGCFHKNVRYNFCIGQ